MYQKIVRLNEDVITGQIKKLMRGSVEETLNELLEAEAEKLTQAVRYEHNEQRQGYRNGHYSRNLTKSSEGVSFVFLDYFDGFLEIFCVVLENTASFYYLYYRLKL